MLRKDTYRNILILFLLTICTMIYIYKDFSENPAVETEAMPVNETIYSEELVYVSGEPIGIYVKTKGVMVVDIGNIRTADGEVCCPCRDYLKQGDYIMEIDGMEVNDKASLINIVNESGGNPVSLLIYRAGRTIETEVTPVMNLEGNYMLGIWVKDDISGIGTMTCVKNKDFFALGHSINDSDTGMQFNISEGAIYNTSLFNIKKPEDKNPGRLEGYIDYENSNIIGFVDGNSQIGIQGKLTDAYREKLSEDYYMNLGNRSEVKCGEVYLLSAISGKKEYYSAEIVRINNDVSNNRSLEIKVTDERLIKLTGGIVQGMSGTPIIQDNKLIGAVTHVFVSDPTKGYGIFIEDMLGR